MTIRELIDELRAASDVVGGDANVEIEGGNIVAVVSRGGGARIELDGRAGISTAELEAIDEALALMPR